MYDKYDPVIRHPQSISRAIIDHVTFLTNFESFYVTVHTQKLEIAKVHKMPVSIFFVKSWKNKG